MTEQQITITEADAQSFDAKWHAFVEGLTPAERALLEARLAGADGDVQGFQIVNLPWSAPTTGARPRPRPGSSAQPR